MSGADSMYLVSLLEMSAWLLVLIIGARVVSRRSTLGWPALIVLLGIAGRSCTRLLVDNLGIPGQSSTPLVDWLLAISAIIVACSTCRTRRAPLPQWRSPTGQSTVEVALALPMLAMLLLAIVEIGGTVAVYMDLTSATRDAARRAVSVRQESNPQQLVIDAFNESMDRPESRDSTVTVAGGWNQDDEVTVTSELPWEIEIAGIHVWDGNLRARSIVVIG